MGQPKEDEPVAYLGGKAAEPPQEVDGYLGGDAPPDSLPALPPANMTGQYSASDFMTAPAEIEDQAPAPIAEAPVEAPADDPSYFQQYANEEPAGETTGTDTVAEQAPSDQTSEFDEPGLPKTISQQDAENIIKRITTKKILPPEVAANEGPRVTSAPELTPRRGMRAGPIIVFTAVLLGGVAALFAFKQELAPYLPPFLCELLNVTPPSTDPVVVETPGPTKEQQKEKALRDLVSESEWRAFGYSNQADFERAQKEMGKPVGNGTAPGGTAPGGTAPGGTAPSGQGGK